MAGDGDGAPVRLLVSGYYGFGNAGDEALLAGLLQGLVERGHEPVVLSARPEATRRLHGVPAVHRLHGLLPALLGCDGLISGGGGLLQDKTSPGSLRYYLGVLGTARAFGKRVTVYGQSVGPLSTRGRRLVGRALRGVPVSVRDGRSRDLLAELGLEAELTADPALLIAADERSAEPREGRADGSRADGCRSEAQIEEPPELLLIPRAGHPELGDALAALAAHYRSGDRAVGILLLHPEQDEEEGRRLERMIPGTRLAGAHDYREALDLVSRARVVASARLHGLIFATATGTPFLGLAYDPKVSGFVAESGGVGFEAPVDHTQLIAAAERSEHLPAGARSRLLALADDGLNWLDRALRGSL